MDKKGLFYVSPRMILAVNTSTTDGRACDRMLSIVPNGNDQIRMTSLLLLLALHNVPTSLLVDVTYLACGKQTLSVAFYGVVVGFRES